MDRVINFLKILVVLVMNFDGQIIYIINQTLQLIFSSILILFVVLCIRHIGLWELASRVGFSLQIKGTGTHERSGPHICNTMFRML